MFKKPPNIKNLSVLRSSDRKKIIQQVVQLYQLENISNEVRNALLPEGAQSAKFATHLDEPGILYYDAQGVEPLWIRVAAPGHKDEALVPTVYTLWQHPSILKSVSTWDHVITKLEGGADLMTPGLTQWNNQIVKGDVVTITAQDGVALAVGIAALDIGKLSKAVGEKGKAVYLVHCFNDELWALGSKSKPPASVPMAETLGKATEELTLESHAEDQNQGETAGQATLENGQGQVEQETPLEPPVGTSAETVSTSSIAEPSTAEIDEAFKSAAIYGLWKLTTDNAQNTLSLPLPSSTLISQHLNPFLPESFSQYTFKKTSWKKAATFLKKYMEKEGILKTKERSGDVVIISINWSHKLVKDFKPYPLEKKENKETKASTKEEESSGQMIQIQELFKPTGKVIKILVEELSKPKDELYTATQIKEVLNEYITRKPTLVNERNPRLIKIDYNLAGLLKPEESNLEYLARDKLSDRLLDSCTAHYTITTPTTSQTRKGKTPKINIVLEKRQGRKTVTRVWGLEAFFINPSELAEELRNNCATSASLGEVKGVKTPMMEVMVQGPLSGAVVEALEKRGVKKSFIVVEDKRK